MTQLLEKPKTTDISEVESTHWVCPDGCGDRDGRIFALCSTEVTMMEETDDHPVDCVVCLDLRYCPICDSSE